MALRKSRRAGFRANFLHNAFHSIAPPDNDTLYSPSASFVPNPNNCATLPKNDYVHSTTPHSHENADHDQKSDSDSASNDPTRCSLYKPPRVRTTNPIPSLCHINPIPSPIQYRSNSSSPNLSIGKSASASLVVSMRNIHPKHVRRFRKTMISNSYFDLEWERS